MKEINRMIVYNVTMYRWGDEENHSYVLGTFSTKTKAEKAAKDEEENRGGKYNSRIVEMTVNTILHDGEFKVVKDVAPHPDFVKTRIV